MAFVTHPTTVNQESVSNCQFDSTTDRHFVMFLNLFPFQSLVNHVPPASVPHACADVNGAPSSTVLSLWRRVSSGGTAAQRRLLLVYQLYWPPARGGAPLAAERKAPRGRVEHHHDEQLDALRGLFPLRRGLSCATPRAVDRRDRGGEAQETLIRKRR